MIFTETKLAGAFIIELDKKKDHRGFFARAWCQNEFEGKGLTTRMVQANLAFSLKRGTLRGMHYQRAPYEEAKLVRCIAGKVYDVIIDLREGSPTHGEWFGIELSAANGAMLYVPEDFAHGYVSLADNTEVFYQVSQFYSPGSESGIRWDDPAFGIQWPVRDNLIISEKDQNWPLFPVGAFTEPQRTTGYRNV